MAECANVQDPWGELRESIAILVGHFDDSALAYKNTTISEEQKRAIRVRNPGDSEYLFRIALDIQRAPHRLEAFNLARLIAGGYAIIGEDSSATEYADIASKFATESDKVLLQKLRELVKQLCPNRKL